MGKYFIYRYAQVHAVHLSDCIYVNHLIYYDPVLSRQHTMYSEAMDSVPFDKRLIHS